MDRGLRTYLRTQWNKNNNKKKAVLLFFFFVICSICTPEHACVLPCARLYKEHSRKHQHQQRRLKKKKKKQSETAPSCAPHYFQGKQERKAETVKAEKEGKEKEKMANKGTACSKRRKKEEPHILRTITPEDKKDQPLKKKKRERSRQLCALRNTSTHTLVVASSCPWLKVIADF